jgi:hypothetical protein
VQPVFIFSGPASGARALGDVLNGNGLACLGQPFDIANPAGYGLGHFLRSCAVGADELIASPDQVLGDYLSFCAETVRAERFCIEVRHDLMHIFNGRSCLFGQRPRLIDYIREHRYEAVHLARRQVFVQVLLRQLGERCPAPPNDKAMAPVALDIRQCEQHIKQLERAGQLMAAWFRDYDRFHDLAHEAVFEAGAVSDGGAALLEAMFGKPVANRAPSLPVAHHDFRRLVANAGEVVAALAEGPRADEVRAVLG